MGELKLIQKYTVAEYLAIDDESESRYEYADGELYAMAGSSMNHNEISGNFFSHLRAGIKKGQKPCKTFMSDIRLYIQNSNRYYYPDVILTCDKNDLDNGKNAEKPLLIIEVMSESTQNKDLGEKLFAYMQIPSLHYYLVVAQAEVFILFYERREDGWYVNAYNDVNATISLPLLETQITIQDIYEGIQWKNTEEEA